MYAGSPAKQNDEVLIDSINHFLKQNFKEIKLPKGKYHASEHTANRI